MKHRGFGFVPWQVIVGVAQAGALGAGSLTQKQGIEKYLKTQSNTLAQTHQQAIELKQKQLAEKEKLQEIAARTDALEAMKVRKVATLAIGVAIAVVVLGTIAALIAFRGGSDEKR